MLVPVPIGTGWPGARDWCPSSLVNKQVADYNINTHCVPPISNDLLSWPDYIETINVVPLMSVF